MKRINLRLDNNVFDKLENYTKSYDISINQLIQKKFNLIEPINEQFRPKEPKLK